MKLCHPPSYEDRAGLPARVGGDEEMILPYTSSTQGNSEGAVTEAAGGARPDEPRGEPAMSFVVPAGAKGAFGEFPEGAV
jgi:hypothetical protein